MPNMSPSMAFRIRNEDEKNYINEVIGRLTDLHKDEISIKGDALRLLCKIFEDGIETIQFKEPPTTAQDVITQVSCNFLKYESEVYVCYETFHKKKKGEPIGSIDEYVIDRCRLCTEGKQVAVETGIQAQLRKKNIKSILDLRDILVNLTQDFSLAQIYICKANLLEEHEIIVSMNGIHLRCPLKDMEDVSVLEYCYNQINPSEMNPPCRYLIDPYINVNIEPTTEAQNIIKDLAQLPEEIPDIKDVDVEVKEKDKDKKKDD